MTPCDLKGELVRVVESQEQIATSQLVDGLEKQALLEEMLEENKPPLPTVARDLHYLLAAPFRYPPLKNGSRFGSKYNSGIFYGSVTHTTALAETAYYRFLFWFGMSHPPKTHSFKTQHTLFAVTYRTARGISLQNEPYASQCGIQLRDPQDYTFSQKLGDAMRKASVEAFEFVSARDPEEGINVALFTPQALACRKPLSKKEWLCETSSKTVSFSARPWRLVQFQLEQFFEEGVLPQPA
ncbi:MAG: RES domain-containing protein [Thiothrix sp.]|nr:MAG: RES domain-containing protein [Thiothrix sp.]